MTHLPSIRIKYVNQKNCYHGKRSIKQFSQIFIILDFINCFIKDLNDSSSILPTFID